MRHKKITVVCSLLGLWGGYCLMPVDSQEPKDTVRANMSTQVTPVLPEVQVQSKDVQRLPEKEINQNPSQAYGSARDLWGFVRTLMDRGDLGGILEARAAVVACSQWAEINDQVAISVSGGESYIKGVFTEKRQFANSELASRCAHFQQVGKLEVSRLLTELNKKIDESGAGDYYEKPPEYASARQIVEMLDSGSPAATVLASIAIGWRWQKALGIEDNDPRASELIQAAYLASCDLGDDCSPTGFKSLSGCVVINQCGKRLFDGWRSGYSDAEIARIEAFKQRLELAIRSRNWAALGIELS